MASLFTSPLPLHHQRKRIPLPACLCGFAFSAPIIAAAMTPVFFFFFLVKSIFPPGFSSVHCSRGKKDSVGFGSITSSLLILELKLEGWVVMLAGCSEERGPVDSWAGLVRFLWAILGPGTRGHRARELLGQACTLSVQFSSDFNLYRACFSFSLSVVPCACRERGKIYSLGCIWLPG